MTSHEQLINKSRISHEQVETTESLARPVQVMSSLTCSIQDRLSLLSQFGLGSDRFRVVGEWVVC